MIGRLAAGAAVLARFAANRWPAAVSRQVVDRLALGLLPGPSSLERNFMVTVVVVVVAAAADLTDGRLPWPRGVLKGCTARSPPKPCTKGRGRNSSSSTTTTGRSSTVAHAALACTTPLPRALAGPRPLLLVAPFIGATPPRGFL